MNDKDLGTLFQTLYSPYGRSPYSVWALVVSMTLHSIEAQLVFASQISSFEALIALSLTKQKQVPKMHLQKDFLSYIMNVEKGSQYYNRMDWLH